MNKFLSPFYAIAAALTLAFSVQASASGGSHIHLAEADIDPSDKASLQRGVAVFTNYCMGCHSMKYARYERVANDLGIPNELYEKNLIFGDAKIGQLMKISMDPKTAQGWFGAAPPDLTLEARLRGKDWIYSYLKAFYKDDSRPYGVNNIIYPKVGMPHVLEGLQGLCEHEPDFHAKPVFDPLSGQKVGGGGCKNYAVPGTISAAQYDEMITDLVNFLVYSGEPSKMDSHRIGILVLIFIVILGVFVHFLNREYWKGIH